MNTTEPYILIMVIIMNKHPEVVKARYFKGRFQALDKLILKALREGGYNFPLFIGKKVSELTKVIVRRNTRLNLRPVLYTPNIFRATLQAFKNKTSCKSFPGVHTMPTS